MSASFHKAAPSGRNQVFYGLLAGNLVVLALIGFFGIRPVFNLLRKHTTEITATKAEITAIQQKTGDLRKLKEIYPAYAATYAPLLDNLPHSKDLAGYQTELDSLAVLTSVQLKTVDVSGKNTTGAKAATTTSGAAAKPTTPTSGTVAPAASGAATTSGGFPSTPVRIDLTGTYATILDFVHRLETMDRITKITGLDLKGSSGTGSMQASIDMQTLYIPGDKL